MVFLGTTFFGYLNTHCPTPSSGSDITRVTLQGARFDDLYLSKDTSLPPAAPVPSQWDYRTILSAQFDHSPEAGNVRFKVENTSDILIRRREKGSFPWLTLFQIPIRTINDFTFLLYDRLNGAKRTYEYAFVPILNGTEGSYYIAEVASDFEGIHVIGESDHYHTDLNVSQSYAHNIQNAVITPLNGKYNHFVRNSRLRYKSGTVAAVWLKMEPDGLTPSADSWRYKDTVIDFLMDGGRKLYKSQDGTLLLVNTVTENQVTDQYDTIEELAEVAFDFEEAGDAASFEDLWESGLISVERGYA